MGVKLYQTLTNINRANLEQNGPIICTDENAWLGTGYYFWDTDIDNAHWWGKVHCRNNYLILRADAQYDDVEHLKIFSDLSNLLSKELHGGKRVRVSEVIEMFLEMDDFSFQAIRAAHVVNGTRIFFTEKGKEFMSLQPKVQVCLFNNAALSLHNLIVVYP
jgi:hypothetical protein